MATIGLALVGNAIGASIGGTILGVGAAAIGQAVGASIGSMVDAALLTPTQKSRGPRLDTLEVQTSSEGDPLACIDGRAKVAGVVIWASRLEEVVRKKKSGGKGSPKSESTTYEYYANFAVALADAAAGEIRHISRVWADNELVDMSGVTMRFYDGSDDQMPDPMIVAKDGEAPAYRGTAYVVFERMPVTNYGNRIPNMAFEVWGQSGVVEELVRGVNIVPISTEWGYSPTVIKTQRFFLGQFFGSLGSLGVENASRFGSTSDWATSLDMLQGILPDAGSVTLVVSWFATDLRAGHCKIEPRVETRDKFTSREWSAGGLYRRPANERRDRDDNRPPPPARPIANLVSQIDGMPAYGSSPDDLSVIEAIRDLRARGLRVVLYPSIIMDIPEGSTLPDPSGAGAQPAYPWRGRVAAEAGRPVADQIRDLMGNAQPSHFSAGARVPAYSGPVEWSYRRFMLHLAALARAAGGVDAILIGSELRGLTQSTDAPGDYPFVDELVKLAGEVKAMLPGAQVSYAADWSEFHSHRIGSEVFFNLDPLWASPAVDFVGIDNYLPLSDWRHGSDHLDYDPAIGRTAVYDLGYLKSQVEGGELWDYHYKTEADRAAQIRTPIFDGEHGEDWVWRQKGIRDWHANRHHNRPGGNRSASATAWDPGSKPIWFTQVGCAAVDLGTNQPNMAIDPKSAESGLPYFSSGQRDDFLQRQYLRATLEYWRDHPGVVDFGNIHVSAWDARPWPEFPAQSDRWSDAPNWRLGHWINGRLGGAPAAEVLARRLEIFHDMPGGAFDVSRAYGQQDGFFLADPTDFRTALQPWEVAGRIIAAEVGGVLVLSSREVAPHVLDLTPDDLVDAEGADLFMLTRLSAEDVPRSAVLRYSDPDRNYETGAARAVIETGTGEAETTAELSFVSDLERMTVAAQIVLRSKAEARESVAFSLPPSVDLRPGQVFTLTPSGGRKRTFLAEEVIRGGARKVTASLFPRSTFLGGRAPARPPRRTVAAPARDIVPVLLDLPILPGQGSPDHVGWVAFHARPWPGGADLYRSPDQETGYSLNLRSGAPSTVGETVAPLDPGTPGIWSPEVLAVSIWSGGLVPRPEIDVLNGANALAIEHRPGEWEVVQFMRAELQPSGNWHLSRLLRGQLGSEHVRAADPLPAGARVVLLDDALSPVEMTPGEIRAPFWFKAAPVGTDPAEAAPVSHTFTGVGRRPLSPVHLRGSVAGGVLSLRWIRRTRIEGDPWADGAEVPLGEESERYRIEVGPLGAPLRTVEVTTPEAQVVLGTISGSQEIRVAQISPTYGPGSAARLLLTI